MTFFNCDIFYYLCKAVWQCPATVLNTPLRRNKDLIADTFTSLWLFLSEGNTCKKKYITLGEQFLGERSQPKAPIFIQVCKEVGYQLVLAELHGQANVVKRILFWTIRSELANSLDCPQHVAEFGGGRKTGIGDESLQHRGFLRVLWSCEKGEVGKIKMVSNLLRNRQLEHGLSEML